MVVVTDYDMALRVRFTAVSRFGFVGFAPGRGISFVGFTFEKRRTASSSDIGM